MNLLLVAVAGHSVGFGHLNRCRTLAAAATKLGFSVTLLIYADAESAARLNTDVAHTILCPTEQMAGAGADGEQTLPHDTDIVIADVIFGGFFDRPEAKILESLRPAKGLLCVLDSLGSASLVQQAPECALDILLTPYVTDSEYRARAKAFGRKQLIGPDYAILPQSFTEPPPREMRNPGNRVLVTCGGSDPGRMTARILEGLDLVGHELELRVVMGPLFSSDLTAEIERLEDRSPHKVSLLNAPDGLREHMVWADLAVAATGLTKYELAATGTPAILFSPDAVHDEVNRPFSAAGTAIDLGVAPAKERIAAAVSALVPNIEHRSILAKAGRRLVDGDGTRRLLRELEGELAVGKP